MKNRFSRSEIIDNGHGLESTVYKTSLLGKKVEYLTIHFQDRVKLKSHGKYEDFSGLFIEEYDVKDKDSKLLQKLLVGQLGLIYNYQYGSYMQTIAHPEKVTKEVFKNLVDKLVYILEYRIVEDTEEK